MPTILKADGLIHTEAAYMRALTLLAAVALLAAACGSGDKKAAPTQPPKDTPAAVASATPKAENTRSVAGSDAGEKTIGSVFGTLFTSGVLGGGNGGDAGTPQFAPGDPALEQYVLSAGDLPDGFTLQQTGAVRVPDGLSAAGKGDIAMSIATKGDVQGDDPRGTVMLMSMAMKFDDLQDLGSALEDAQGVTEQQLRDAIEQNTGSIPGLGVTDVHVLDADGLGDGGFGMSMTLDMGEFLKTLQSAFEGSDATPDPSLDDFVLNMKMYVFGRGDLGAGVISMSFGRGAQTGVDELALAKVVDSKLPH